MNSSKNRRKKIKNEKLLKFGQNGWYIPLAPTEKKLKNCLKICAGKIPGTIIWDVSNHILCENENISETKDDDFITFEKFRIFHNEKSDVEKIQKSNFSRFLLCGSGRTEVLKPEKMKKFGNYYRKDFENDFYSMILLDKNETVNFITHIVMSKGRLS